MASRGMGPEKRLFRDLFSRGGKARKSLKKPPSLFGPESPWGRQSGPWGRGRFKGEGREAGNGKGMWGPFWRAGKGPKAGNRRGQRIAHMSPKGQKTANKVNGIRADLFSALEQLYCARLLLSRQKRTEGLTYWKWVRKAYLFSAALTWIGKKGLPIPPKIRQNGLPFFKTPHSPLILNSFPAFGPKGLGTD